MTAYTRNFRSRLAPLGALLAALALAGCGVKSALEPPPGTPPPAQTVADTPAAQPLGAPPTRTAGPRTLSPDQGLQRALRRGPPPERPDEPFALDPLL